MPCEARYCTTPARVERLMVPLPWVTAPALDVSTAADAKAARTKSPHLPNTLSPLPCITNFVPSYQTSPIQHSAAGEKAAVRALTRTRDCSEREPTAGKMPVSSTFVT